MVLQIPLIIFTIFWVLVGGVCPFLVPKGPNRGIVQMMIIGTAVCLWLFWFCTYLAQLNPLIGPQMMNKTYMAILQSRPIKP